LGIVDLGEAAERIDGSRLVPFSFLNDPKHWRDRAAEARVLASEMNDLDRQAMMLRLADDYDNLAIRAEKRSDDKPTSSE
jgi:hypothetical protein